MTTVRVNTDDYADAATPADTASKDADHTMTTLMGKLAAGAHVGTDPISAPLAHAVDKAAEPALKSGCELTGRLSALANAIRTSAHNHAQADSRAALTPVKAPTAAKTEKLSTAVKTPPSSLAGGGTDPEGWENVKPYVTRAWPNGLTAKMHAAADAYKNAAEAIGKIPDQTRKCTSHLDSQTSPEISTAQTKANKIGQDATTTANELRRSGTALEVYAKYLDDNRDNVEKYLRNALTTLHQNQSSGDGYAASASAAGGSTSPAQVEQFWRQAATQVDNITAAIQREANQLAGDLSGTDPTKLQSEINDINASTTSTRTHHPVERLPGQDALDEAVNDATNLSGAVDQASYLTSLRGKGWNAYFKAANVEAWDSRVTGMFRGTSPSVGLTEVTGALGRGLDFRAWGAAAPEASKLGQFASKVGPLGAIGIASSAASVTNDVRAGDYGKAADDGATGALAAGAMLAPPPADMVCGAASLGIAAYQNIPVVHQGVDKIASWGGDAAKSVGHFLGL